MDLGLTWFDFFATAILALSGVMAFARGLIREVFSIIAFIGAAIAAVFFADMLRPLVEQLTPLSGPLASVAAGLVIFLIVFIAITVIASTLAKQTHQSTEIGSFDRAAGLAFGVLRGVIVMALFVLLLQRGDGQTEDPTQDSIRSARTYPMYASVASVLEAVAPKARQRAHDMIERQQGESAPIPPAQPAEPAPETGTSPN
jgi:membrane protein required for colicin V production